MTIDDALSGAAQLESTFVPLVQNLERVDKGVRASEMLFLCGAVRHLNPRRFLESGTAGGQSTLQMALCYPEAKIISFDLNESDSYAQIARKRLADSPNVELRYGDSQALIPALLQQDDVVLIDGPKGFKALRFAFELLATGKPAVVFIHDLYLGLPERRFLDLKVPHAFFSDDPAFVWNFSYIDSKSRTKPTRSGTAPRPGSPPEGYGATFACIPRVANLDAAHYKRLILERGIWRAVQRARQLLGLKVLSSGG